jgi:hypothetical protein
MAITALIMTVVTIQKAYHTRTHTHLKHHQLVSRDFIHFFQIFQRIRLFAKFCPLHAPLLKPIAPRFKRFFDAKARPHFHDPLQNLKLHTIVERDSAVSAVTWLYGSGQGEAFRANPNLNPHQYLIHDFAH